ncbi:Uncharacterized protein HZ326_18888 [Fusarium oxysporum f. sp. albedinis]|nr:Uncharacterized protein HZ326_18888 [Fusarium oxysporum f. sp. albedinis]
MPMEGCYVSLAWKTFSHAKELLAASQSLAISLILVGPDSFKAKHSAIPPSITTSCGTDKDHGRCASIIIGLNTRRDSYRLCSQYLPIRCEYFGQKQHRPVVERSDLAAPTEN